jgi:hypothetical protein
MPRFFAPALVLLAAAGTGVLHAQPGEGMIEAEIGGQSAELAIVPGPELTVRFVDAAFRPLETIELVVMDDGDGEGEVWVEVEAAPDDDRFDDASVEDVSVRVTSDSDPQGELVVCTETAADSRLFRSNSQIIVRAVPQEVQP